MAQLAIRGHATRGDEVISILKMLGGKLRNVVSGDVTCGGYYINSNGYIDCKHTTFLVDTTIYTLEEFLKNFPYKVGDKVLINDDVTDVYTITSMTWVGRRVAYKIRAFDGIDDVHEWFADEIKPYTEHIEETMEEKIESFEIVEGYCADEVKIEFDPSKYEMVERKEGYYVVKKQPSYPQTFNECCAILGLTELGIIGGYRHGLLTQFRNLLICRDAYWKIEGDWKFSFDEECYYLCNEYHEIQKFKGTCDCNAILAFPTKEMRDAFFENFKDLINECKSLL